MSSACNKSRCQHIDIIKGIAMLSIIIMHCTSSFISRENGAFIGYSWNVAVFFIIGGFFLNVNKLEYPIKFLIGKIKSLYLPATVIYGLNVLLHNVFISIGFYPLGVSHHHSVKPFEYYEIKDFMIGLLKVFLAGGSGELSMGAMWFLYSLLYAFICLTFIYWVVSKLLKNKVNQYHLTTLLLLLGASISCTLTNKYDLTVNRFSTSVTAMFLIWMGMFINKKLQWKYDSWYGFLTALTLFIHCIIMRNGDMALANNKYQDIVTLLVGSSSLIYLWGFIGKKIESNIIGKFLALIGRESLYLMSFHILGFLVCNVFLVELDVFSITDSKGLYTYNLGDNGWLLLLYVVFALGISFAILYASRMTIKYLKLCLRIQ